MRLAQRDPREFVRVYDRYGNRILIFLTRRLFDAEVAYDLHQEVFAIAYEKRSQFRGRVAAEEEAWLLAIARSQVARYCRSGDVERGAMQRLGLARQELDDDAIERVLDAAELESLKPGITAALDDLPLEQREAVVLRVVHEHSYEEIATALGVSKDVVRARVSRGLRALASALDPEMEGNAA